MLSRTAILVSGLFLIVQGALSAQHSLRHAIAQDEYEMPPDPSMARPEPLSSSRKMETVGDKLAQIQDGFPISRIYPPDPIAPDVTDRFPDLYLHSAEFWLSNVDLKIEGRGFDFVWGRKYRSRLGPSTAIGNGWDFSYNIRIESLAGSDGTDEPPAIRLHDGNTRSDVYRRDPAGVYVKHGFFREGRFEDSGFILTFANHGTWLFHSLDGTPSAGRLANITDRHGNRMTFAYDSEGKLTRITDTLDRDIHIQYDANDRVSRLTDFADREVVYEYYDASDPNGSAGDLKSVRSPIVVGTPNGNDFPEGKTTTYTYTRGFTDERLNHNLLSVIDPCGRTRVLNEYHPTEDPSDPHFDRVVAQRRGEDGPIQIVQEFEFATIRGSKGVTAIVNDGCGHVVEITYDSRNRRIRRVENTGRADPFSPTTRTENRPQDPVRSSDPDRFVTHYHYNLDSLVTAHVYPNGTVTEWDYEPNPTRWLARMNVREIHHLPGSYAPVGDQSSIDYFFEYLDGFGGLEFVTRFTDARGSVTEHEYDEFGNRIATNFPAPGIRETYEYNSFGQLTRRTYPAEDAGRVDAFAYYGSADGAANGYLMSSIVDEADLALTTGFEYDVLGRATRIIDPRGADRQFVFNELGQIVQELSRPIHSGRNPPRFEKLFFYDACDLLARVDVQNVDEQGQLYPNDYLTTLYEYETLDRLTRVVEEVDPSHDIVTQYAYDPCGNLSEIRFGECTNGNQPDNRVQFFHDERNLLFQKVRAPGSASQSSMQWDYDGNKNVVRHLDGLESAATVTLSRWDAFNRLIDLTDAMGNVQEMHYDAASNVTQKVILGELIDEAGSTQNVRLSEENYQFDVQGRLTLADRAHFDPATGAPIGDGSSSTEYAYDPASRITTITDDNRHETRFVYDTALRQKEIHDAKGNWTEFAYDANGNTITKTEHHRSDIGSPEEVVVTSYLYDGEDRHTRTSDNAGNVIGFGIDSRGNRTLVGFATGQITRQTYDGIGRLLQKVRDVDGDGASVGDPDDIVTSKVWDDSMRVLALVDDNGNTLSYSYDALDRLTMTSFADGTSQTATYDVRDNPTSTADANGTSMSYSYDALGRRTSVAIAPGPSVATDTTFESYAYDGMSRIVLGEDDDSVVFRTHDSLSKMLTEVQNGKTFTMEYDGTGNLLRAEYPGGKRLAWTYDELNRPKTLTNKLIIANWDYIGSRVERRTYPVPGAETLYTYDAGQRLIEARHRIGPNSVIAFASEFDLMGRRTSLQHVAPGHTNYRWEYSYDGAHRLASSRRIDDSGEVVTESDYDLDGVGNRLSVAGDVDPGAYFMDSNDRPVNQYSATPFDGRVHDDVGNLTAAGLKTLVFDAHNQLVEYSDSPEGDIHYRYDVFGRRIERARGRGTERYFYLGWQICEERDASELVTGVFVYGLTVDNVLYMKRGDDDFFFYEDSLGSVMFLTGDAGELRERYEYGDFGYPSFFDAQYNPLSSSMVGNPYLFSGRYFESRTGLYDYRSRNLDPRAGRFISRDKIGIWGDLNNHGNAFSYVGNSPQSRVDPFGEKEEPTWWDGLVFGVTSWWKGTGIYVRDHRASMTERAYAANPGNPNPVDGTDENPGDLATMVALLKQKGGPLQRRVNPHGTPLGRYLNSHGKGIGPVHNPSEMGFEFDQGGGGSGGGFSPNGVNMNDQLNKAIKNAQSSLGKGGIGFGSGIGGLLGFGTPSPGGGGGQGNGGGPGKRERQDMGFFGEDMPGPPELVNPPPVRQ